MATLKSGELSFDFRYSGFECGWVQYQFYFLWKGKPVIRDDALKRRNDYWNSRSEGAFLANEDESDCFLPFLQKILASDKADYWEPIEPDIIVGIYPDDFFPFLKSHKTLVWESEESRQNRKAREQLKKEQGKLPDDLFTLIAFVDAYNLEGAETYYGEGLSLHMVVTRDELQSFADELEKEYSEFKLRFKVDEYRDKDA